MKEFYNKKRPSKGWSGVHLLHDNASSHRCEVVKSFLASEKVKVLNHPPYSPDLSPCDFFLFPRLKKMLSGNKYTSRSTLGRAIYQCLHTKRRLFICFLRLGLKVTKTCFSKEGIHWRFVIKICLIKRSTEVIRTQWQNFLQDPRSPMLGTDNTWRVKKFASTCNWKLWLLNSFFRNFQEKITFSCDFL